MIGTVEAKLIDHVLKEVGEKNTPCLSLKWEVKVDGEHVYSSHWLTDAAFPYTMKLLTEVLGWDAGDDLNDWNGTGNFVGMECDLVLAEEEYNGKVSTKVKFVNRKGGGSQKPAEDKLAQSLKAKVLAYRQGNKATPENAGLKL